MPVVTGRAAAINGQAPNQACLSLPQTAFGWLVTSKAVFGPAASASARLRLRLPTGQASPPRCRLMKPSMACPGPTQLTAALGLSPIPFLQPESRCVIAAGETRLLQPPLSALWRPLLTIHVYTPRPFHHSQRVPGDERHTHTHADKQPHPRPFTLVLVVSPPAHVMLATPPTPLANHPSSTCPRKPSRQLTAAAKWYHTRNTLPHPAPSAHQAHGRAGGRSWSTCIVDAHSPPPRPRPRPLPTTQSAFDHLDAKNNTRPLHWPRSHYPMRHPQSLPRRNQVGLEGDALAD